LRATNLVEVEVVESGKFQMTEKPNSYIRTTQQYRHGAFPREPYGRGDEEYASRIPLRGSVKQLAAWTLIARIYAFLMCRHRSRKKKLLCHRIVIATTQTESMATYANTVGRAKNGERPPWQAGLEDTWPSSVERLAKAPCGNVWHDYMTQNKVASQEARKSAPHNTIKASASFQNEWFETLSEKEVNSSHS